MKEEVIRCKEYWSNDWQLVQCRKWGKKSFTYEGIVHWLWLGVIFAREQGNLVLFNMYWGSEIYCTFKENYYSFIHLFIHLFVHSLNSKQLCVSYNKFKNQNKSIKPQNPRLHQARTVIHSFKTTVQGLSELDSLNLLAVCLWEQLGLPFSNPIQLGSSTFWEINCSNGQVP